MAVVYRKPASSGGGTPPKRAKSGDDAPADELDVPGGGGGGPPGVRLEVPDDLDKLPTTCQFTRTSDRGVIETCARQFTEAFPARLEFPNGHVCEGTCWCLQHACELRDARLRDPSRCKMAVSPSLLSLLSRRERAARHDHSLDLAEEARRSREGETATAHVFQDSIRSARRESEAEAVQRAGHQRAVSELEAREVTMAAEHEARLAAASARMSS